MASDQHPHSKIFGGNPNAFPTFPKSDPVVVELPADDLIDAGGTRPIQVAAIHAAAGQPPMSGPGRALPFTPPPPPPAYPEPVMIPSQTPPPVVGFGTMQSVQWQGQQPEPSGSYVQMAPQQAYAQTQQQQQQQYPSFAPTAMDVQHQQQWQQQQPQQPKKKSRAGLIVGIILGVGFFGLLAVGGGGYAYWKYYLEPAAEQAISQASVQSSNNDTTSSSDTTPAATTATPASTTPTVAATGTTAAKIDPPPVVTSTNRSTSWKPPATTTTTSRVTTTTTTTAKKDDTAKVEPKADPKADAKADAPKTDSEGGTGTVRSYTAEAGKPITIDGAMAGVAPAPLTVTCGSHQIQVGSAKPKTVNVPCGGAVTVGSPDGT